LPGTNTLAYFAPAVSDEEKGFMASTPETSSRIIERHLSVVAATFCRQFGSDVVVLAESTV
jgi:hypothetical protein